MKLFIALLVLLASCTVPGTSIRASPNVGWAKAVDGSNGESIILGCSFYDVSPVEPLDRDRPVSEVIGQVPFRITERSNRDASTDPDSLSAATYAGDAGWVWFNDGFASAAAPKASPEIPEHSSGAEGDEVEDDGSTTITGPLGMVRVSKEVMKYLAGPLIIGGGLYARSRRKTGAVVNDGPA